MSKSLELTLASVVQAGLAACALCWKLIGNTSRSFHQHICRVENLENILTVLYCTVLYCTVLYCTVLYCTVLYCTVLYCNVL